MDLTGMTITLGSIIAIVGVVIAVLNFFASRNKNTKDDEARLVRIEASLVRIEENTSDLKNRVDSHDKMLTKHEGEISGLKEKCKKRGY